MVVLPAKLDTALNRALWEEYKLVTEFVNIGLGGARQEYFAKVAPINMDKMTWNQGAVDNLNQYAREVKVLLAAASEAGVEPFLLPNEHLEALTFLGVPWPAWPPVEVDEGGAAGGAAHTAGAASAAGAAGGAPAVAASGAPAAGAALAAGAAHAGAGGGAPAGVAAGL